MNYSYRSYLTSRRRSLLCGVAVIASGLSSTVWAQPPAATPPAVHSASLETVVVTAQRRRESVQKTPLVVEVLSAKTLTQAGATDVSRVAQLVPGVHVDVGTLNGTQIGIRGIENNNVNVGADPSISQSVDDIYIARPQAAIASIYDVARVEILKGPQGTLYGRNSISGAMNIVTNDPVVQKYTGNISAEFGNYDAHTFEGAVNIPFGNEVAARFAFETVNHDGYVFHFFNDADTQAGRIKLLYQPSDSLKAIFSASIYHEGGAGEYAVAYPFVGGDPWNSASGIEPNPPHTALGGAKVGFNDHVYDLSGKLTWDTAPATTTLIAGFTQFDEDYVAPPNTLLAYLDRIGRSNQVTTELRVASHSTAAAAGTYSWVGGLFFYQEIQNQLRHVVAFVPFGPGGSFVNLDQHAGYPHVYAGSAAVFGQGTYAITDHLRATLGVRGTVEAKNATGDNITVINGGPPNISLTPGNETDRAFNYRAEVETDITPNSLLYASITTGFHGGGWQDGTTALDANYHPEYLTSYEVGSKNEFIDHRLRLNLDGYYYDYRNFLVNVNDELAPTCACAVNAQKAWAEGIELDTQYALTPDDIFGISAAYEDTDYSKFIVALPFYPQSASPPLLPSYNLGGTQFPSVSKYSGTLSYIHTFELANGDTISAGVFSQFKTKFFGELSESSSAVVPGSTDTDFNLSYASAQRWTVTGFVRNIENGPGIENVGGAGPGSTGVATANIGAPRTYGGRFEYSF